MPESAAGEAIVTNPAEIVATIRDFCGSIQPQIRHFRSRLSFLGVREGINGRVQLLIQRSRGYRNRERLKTDIIFHIGSLELKPQFCH